MGDSIIKIPSVGEGKVVETGYVDINGNRETTDTLRDLNEMCMKYDFDTNFFVMASCLHENFNKIARVDFGKHISLNEIEGINIDMFRLDNNIFINALSINVNGLLQSGFEEYYLDTSEFIDKIQKADELFKDGKLAALSDDQVLQQSKDSAFCLSVGGQVFNKDKKYYDYQVPVYYNPSTGTILVGEISNGGGNIYLSGVISSTGNGRIVAMDGAPDVTIRNNNDLAKDIKLYGINTTGVSGKVTIVDTNKKTETVITRDGAVVKNLLDGTKNNESLTNCNYTYTPGQGLRYVWVTGQDKGTRTFYQRKKEGKWWGLSDPKEVTKDPTHTATNMGESYLESDAKGNVATIEHETFKV